MTRTMLMVLLLVACDGRSRGVGEPPLPRDIAEVARAARICAGQEAWPDPPWSPAPDASVQESCAVCFRPCDYEDCDERAWLMISRGCVALMEDYCGAPAGHVWLVPATENTFARFVCWEPEA